MTEENENLIPENIDDKLYTVKYKPDEDPHLVVENEECKKCKDKVCTYICPANVYNWEEDEKKVCVGYENCLECGACRIACKCKGLRWRYPKGGCGATFKCG